MPRQVNVLEWNNDDNDYEVLLDESMTLLYYERPEIREWSKNFIRDLNNDGKFEVILPTIGYYQVYCAGGCVSLMKFQVYEWNGAQYVEAVLRFPEVYDNEVKFANELLQKQDLTENERANILKYSQDVNGSEVLSSWQTYRSDEFGFEVKYPPAYRLDSGLSKVLRLIWPNHSFIDIEVISTEKSIDEYINDYIDANKTGFEGTPSLGVHRRLMVTISDQSAIQLEVSYPAIPAAGIVTYIELADGSLIRFGITDWSDSPNIGDLRKVYDPILSTFRFVGNGIIEGSLSYPSEGIPSNMRVCAEDITTRQRYCTSNHLKDRKYFYGTGYKIEVPVGNYYVFAFLPEREDWKAYYSEFVSCGLNVECSSHEPIRVSVKVGETVSGIDPIDWYAP